MVTVVYIDSVALLNLIINYLLLLAAGRIAGAPLRRLRILGGAAIGALYAAAVWLPGFDFLANFFWKAASAALMVLAAYAGSVPWKRAARIGLVFLGVSFALGGVVLAIGLLAGAPPSPGGVPYIPVDFKTLFLTAGISYVVLTLVFRHAARHGPGETVGISVAYEGRELSLTGLIDTGHTLVDPMTGRSVLVVEGTLARRLLPEELRALITPELLDDPTLLLSTLGDLSIARRFSLVPYGAVGVKAGFLLAFRPDYVTLGKKTYKSYLIGLSPTPVSENRDIGALVSPL